MDAAFFFVSSLVLLGGIEARRLLEHDAPFTQSDSDVRERHRDGHSKRYHRGVATRTNALDRGGRRSMMNSNGIS